MEIRKAKRNLKFESLEDRVTPSGAVFSVPAPPTSTPPTSFVTPAACTATTHAETGLATASTHSGVVIC
jgi:hypothetical protein